MPSIWKPVAFIALLVFGVYEGAKYLVSDDFQNYGDREKAAWTCKVTNMVAGILMVSDRKKRAQELYKRVLKRCPKSSHGELAMFRIARIYHDFGNRGMAREGYDKFVETFPKSERVKTAQRAAQNLYNR